MARYALPKLSREQKVKLPLLSRGIYVARLVGKGTEGSVKVVVE